MCSREGTEARLSVSANYVRVTKDDYDRFLVRPEIVGTFLLNDQDSPNGIGGYAEELSRQRRLLVLGSQWQAVYYLLANEVGQETPPDSLPEPNEFARTGVLAKAVFGGRPVPAEEYNDVIWYLTPEEILEIARELDARTPEAVREDFESREHGEVQIYHQHPPSTWSGLDLDFLLSLYSHLRDFYLDASKEGNAVFVWLG